MALDIDCNLIQEQHDNLVHLLADPNLDHNKRRATQKEVARLATILEKHRELSLLDQQIDEIKAQATETDLEMAALFQEEVEELVKKRAQEEKSLEDYLFPPDPLNDRSVYLEIRSGTGGQEAALFVADLLRMYTNYAEKMGWRTSLEDTSQTDLGGFKEVVLFIKGKEVYGHLKHESGVHRVQRVPQTETAGRVHTSTATVAVLPEAGDIEVNINPADLRIDTYRAGGAGGQHVNRTDSAVRITHQPTGVVVTCQDERSQHKNKAKAMKILKSRLFAMQVEQQAQERSKQRREQVGTGERAEKVRTYNFPQNRVTDHQADITLKHLDMVMQGALDEIIQALQDKERELRKKVAI